MRTLLVELECRDCLPRKPVAPTHLHSDPGKKDPSETGWGRGGSGRRRDTVHRPTQSWVCPETIVGRGERKRLQPQEILIR